MIKAVNIIKKVLTNHLMNASQVGSIQGWKINLQGQKTHTKCGVVTGTYARKGDVLV